MDRRIAPPKDLVKGLLDRLVDPEPGAAYRLFKSKQKALMFAAALGYHRGKRTEVDGRGEGIRFEIFEAAIDDGFVNALAVAEAGDLKVLAPDRDEERVTIFEEYAHTGLVEMGEVCFQMTGDPMAALVGLTDEVRAIADEEMPGVDPAIRAMLMG